MAIFGFGLDVTFPKFKKCIRRLEKTSLHLNFILLLTIAKENSKRENISEIVDTPPKNV